MAAYIRLASQSQAKFQNKRNWDSFRLPCAAAPAQSTASANLSLRFSPRPCADVNRHTLSQWPSQAFPSLIRSWFMAAYLARQPVAGVDTFDVAFALNSTLFRLVWKVARFWHRSKMAESRDRSLSTGPQLKFPGCSHFWRRSNNHRRCQQCRLNDGLTLCAQESPCEVCKDWLPEAW